MNAREQVCLLGAGGHARVLRDALHLSGVEVIGCIAPTAPGADWASDLPWLGADDAIAGLPPETRLVVALGSTGPGSARRGLFERALAVGPGVRSVMHPASIIADDVTMGRGVQILAGAILQAGAHVGDNVIVNSGAIVEHDVHVADHVHIAPGAVVCGGSVVGEGAHIGAGATIIQGIRIGAGALIAAGAVVIRDVAPGHAVAGNPARPMAGDGDVRA